MKQKNSWSQSPRQFKFLFYDFAFIIQPSTAADTTKILSKWLGRSVRKFKKTSIKWNLKRKSPFVGMKNALIKCLVMWRYAPPFPQTQVHTSDCISCKNAFTCRCRMKRRYFFHFYYWLKKVLLKYYLEIKHLNMMPDYFKDKAKDFIQRKQLKKTLNWNVLL